MIPFNQYALYQAGEACRPPIYGSSITFDGVDGYGISSSKIVSSNGVIRLDFNLKIGAISAGTESVIGWDYQGGGFFRMALKISGSNLIIVRDGGFETIATSIAANSTYEGYIEMDRTTATCSLDWNINSGAISGSNTFAKAGDSPSSRFLMCNSLTSTFLPSNQYGNSTIYSAVITDNSNVIAQYNVEEQTGSTLYDASGFGNNLTLNGGFTWSNGITDIYSWADNVGYSKPASVVIPRDESSPTLDVLGNPLEFTGPACGI